MSRLLEIWKSSVTYKGKGIFIFDNMKVALVKSAHLNNIFLVLGSIATTSKYIKWTNYLQRVRHFYFHKKMLSSGETYSAIYTKRVLSVCPQFGLFVHLIGKYVTHWRWRETIPKKLGPHSDSRYSKISDPITRAIRRSLCNEWWMKVTEVCMSYLSFGLIEIPYYSTNIWKLCLLVLGDG